jgi:hypothetical protein
MNQPAPTRLQVPSSPSYYLLSKFLQNPIVKKSLIIQQIFIPETEITLHSITDFSSVGLKIETRNVHIISLRAFQWYHQVEGPTVCKAYIQTNTYLSI